MRKILSVCAVALAATQAIPATAAEFLFIRHAESATNAGTATTVAEIIDPSLTALGQQQATNLASYLNGLDVTSIYTSAYQRTALTIAPTATNFGLTPTADARTNEWYFGDMTSPSDLNYAQVYGVFGAWAAGNTSAKLNLPNAESLDDMVARVLPAWQEIIATHKDDSGVVVIVGHGAAMSYVMPYLVDNVSMSFAAGHGLANTSIIDVKLFNGEPYVANWQGTAFSAPVPEPESYAMLLAGLGMLGFIARRKKQITV